MVVGDEVGEGTFDADVQLAEVVEGEAVVLADGEDAVDVFVADAGDAEEGFAGGGVDVDGKELRVGAGPGGLRIFGQREVWVGVGGEFGGLEAVEAYEPVGLVEAVLADERSGFEGEAGVGLGVGAEAGVVDAAELVGGVEAGGGRWRGWRQ